MCVTGFLQIPNIEVLFIFRFAQGVLVGNYMTLIPEYISEICPKEVASYYSVFPQISVVMGVLVAYTLGVIYTVSGLDYTIFWRLQMAFPFVPTIVQLGFIAFSYIP